jgi:hypothetical protein
MRMHRFEDRVLTHGRKQFCTDDGPPGSYAAAQTFNEAGHKSAWGRFDHRSPRSPFVDNFRLADNTPESSMFSNVHADPLGYLVSPAAKWMICASVRIDGGEIKSI